MEENPVSQTNRLGILSFILGSIAFPTSFFFIYLLYLAARSLQFISRQLLVPFHFFEHEIVFMTPVSSLIGLAGIIIGVVAGKRTSGKNWMSTAGILLGVLAILGGCPFLIIVWF